MLVPRHIFKYFKSTLILNKNKKMDLSFVNQFNNMLNPPDEEKQKEPEPEEKENNSTRDFYNREVPKYRKKPLDKGFIFAKKIKKNKNSY